MFTYIKYSKRIINVLQRDRCNFFFFFRTQAEKKGRPLYDFKGFDVCTCNYFTNYFMILKQYFTSGDY